MFSSGNLSVVVIFMSCLQFDVVYAKVSAFLKSKDGHWYVLPNVASDKCCLVPLLELLDMLLLWFVIIVIVCCCCTSHSTSNRRHVFVELLCKDY